MAQHDYVIDNSTGATVRADINSVLQAIASNNSGSSDPSTTYAFQLFADTTNNVLKIRNAANNGFINLFTLSGGVDVDAASNFNEDVTFTGASANIVFDKSDNALEFADNAKATFGAAADLEVFHDGSNSFIKDTGTGSLLIRGSTVSIQSTSGEAMIEGVADGAVTIKHDNSTKFATLSNGVQITGTVDVNGGGITLEDSAELQFGASADLVLKHDGSDSFINDTGTGALKICSNLFRVNNAANSEAMIKAEENGGVELYFDATKRFETTSSGISVTGSVFSSTGVIGEDASNHFDFVTDNRIAVSINGSEEFRFESDGDFHADGDVIAFSTTISSDEKLKENIKVVPDALKKVEALRGVTFDWKRDSKSSAGVIAQDVMSVLPEAVKEVQGLNDKESYLSVNYNALTSILIEAIKDLSARIKILEA